MGFATLPLSNWVRLLKCPYDDFFQNLIIFYPIYFFIPVLPLPGHQPYLCLFLLGHTSTDASNSPQLVGRSPTAECAAVAVENALAAPNAGVPCASSNAGQPDAAAAPTPARKCCSWPSCRRCRTKPELVLNECDIQNLL
jgi:hypothetical protein